MVHSILTSNNNTVLLSIGKATLQDGGDRLDIYQLSDDTDWIDIFPFQGSLHPAGEEDIFIILDATDLLPAEYQAELVFSHNAIGGETIIPIDLTVIDPNAAPGDKSIMPYDYMISAIYPNPFNSTVRINFTVPEITSVSIKLFDISGSMVEEITNGVHDSGRHSAIWDASGVTSGIYFAQLDAEGFSQIAKLILMK